MATSTIVLLTTGGTVAATTTADGAVPALSAADLLPDLSAPRTDPLPDITVSAVDLMSVDSSAMTSADRSRIIGAIGDALAGPEVVAVVVTHGTDTMEETAYLADLFHTDERPVVFTGAQFPADAPTPTARATSRTPCVWQPIRHRAARAPWWCSVAGCGPRGAFSRYPPTIRSHSTRPIQICHGR